jgi:ubiquinone/menaquinone biosynthesis C-methylase UbiE
MNSSSLGTEAAARMQDARIDQSLIPKVYGRVAKVYDVFALLFEASSRKRCLELAAVRDGEALLEVAVGTGLTFRELVRANPGGRNEGVDLTPEMLARTRARLEASGAMNYRLTHGDAFRLPFEDGAFDLLVNSYMFDMIREQDFAKVLAEFRRVLKPGGRMVLVNMTVPRSRFHAIGEELYRLSPTLMGGCRGVHLAPSVERAGFTGLRREYFTQLTFPSEVLFARKPREPGS